MFCRKCGKEISAEAKYCPFCGAEIVVGTTISENLNSTIPESVGNVPPIFTSTVSPMGMNPVPPVIPKKKIYKKWWFWVVVVIAFLFIVGLFSDGESGAEPTDATEKTTVKSTIETTIPPTTEGTTKQTTSVKETKKEYCAKCKTITYKELARNPDSHKGEFLKITGQVIQVSEGYFSTDLRIDMTKDQYGYWSDTIYSTVVLPEGSDRILEDDIITIYGQCEGAYTYTSVMGASVTLPKISVEYYTVKE